MLILGLRDNYADTLGTAREMTDHTQTPGHSGAKGGDRTEGRAAWATPDSYPGGNFRGCGNRQLTEGLNIPALFQRLKSVHFSLQ